MTDAALVAVLDGAEGGRRIHIAERLTVGRGDDVGLFQRPDQPRRRICGLAQRGGGQHEATG